jgi:hypothetical protein
MQAFDQDLRTGQPIFRLIKRYATYFGSGYYVVFDEIPMLRRAGVEPFKHWRGDTGLREIAMPAVPTVLHQMTWQDGTGHGTGNTPYVILALPEPTFVAGIRISFVHSNEKGSTPLFRVLWKTPNQKHFTEDQSYFDPYTDTGQQTVTMWIDETIDQLRIDPDNKPCEFGISELTLIVPEGKEQDRFSP